MSSLVVDTHAAVWYLLKSSRLSTAAAAALEQATETEGRIYLASISLVEVIYLEEKGRVSQEAVERLLAALSDPKTGSVLAPLDLGITEAVARISRDSIPDMPDGSSRRRQFMWNYRLLLVMPEFEQPISKQSGKPPAAKTSKYSFPSCRSTVRDSSPANLSKTRITPVPLRYHFRRECS